MANIEKKIPVPGKNALEIFEWATQNIRGVLEKSPLGDVEVESNPTRRQVSARSKLFSAQLVCEDELICLTIELSFLARPFRSKIEENIEVWVRSRL